MIKNPFYINLENY